MTEIFRQRVEAPVSPEIEPQAPQPLINDEPRGDKASDPLTAEEHKLEIWEGLNRRKFGHDLFNIRETHDTFPVKAQFPYIDKFIRSELAERHLEPNIENYEKILAEYEDEAGTQGKETYYRLQRLFNYIQIIKKQRELKQKKDSFKLYTNGDF